MNLTIHKIQQTLNQWAIDDDGFKDQLVNYSLALLIKVCTQYWIEFDKASADVWPIGGLGKLYQELHNSQLLHLAQVPGAC